MTMFLFFFFVDGREYFVSVLPVSYVSYKLRLCRFLSSLCASDFWTSNSKILYEEHN